MSKGGPREGAGRPGGSRGKRTRDSIAKAEALWPTSLEVLLESMPARTRRRRAGRGRGVRVNCGPLRPPEGHAFSRLCSGLR
jgi:hypothetical protein